MKVYEGEEHLSCDLFAFERCGRMASQPILFAQYTLSQAGHLRLIPSEMEKYKNHKVEIQNLNRARKNSGCCLFVCMSAYCWSVLRLS